MALMCKQSVRMPMRLDGKPNRPLSGRFRWLCSQSAMLMPSTTSMKLRRCFDVCLQKEGWKWEHWSDVCVSVSQLLEPPSLE
mmetsp:Transcript_41128/g.102311  ORF Transcript_41128/g.102311 Transcript_41128/m.102311 type:complete len:82 (+) Transcript_41128:226-471(+)